MILQRWHTASKGIRTIGIVFVGIALAAQPLAGIIFAPRANALDAPIVINEIALAPGSATWVELYNTTNAAIDISGWHLTYGADTVGGPITDGTQIAGTGFYVVDLTGAVPPASTGTPLQLISTGVTIDSVDTWTSATNESYARTSDGGATWSQAAPTKGITNQVSPVPQLAIEQFHTVNGDYKGISVGFGGSHFGTVNNVTVDVTRADGSHVTKHGTQGLFDMLSGSTATVHLTAPIVIQAGAFTEAGDAYWQPTDPTLWMNGTSPVSVTVSVTDDNGTTQASSGTFSQGAPDWPTYEDLLPPVVTPPVEDTDPPVLTVDGDTTMKLDGTATLTVTSNEPLAALFVFIGDSQLLTGITELSDTSWQITYVPATVGSYTFLIRGEDMVGNRNDDIHEGAIVNLTINPNPPTPAQATAASQQLTAAVTALTQPLDTVKELSPTLPIDRTSQGDEDVTTLSTQADKTMGSDLVSPTDKAVIIPTGNGWKIFGVLWYWWALIVAVIGALGWRRLVVAQRRHDVA